MCTFNYYSRITIFISPLLFMFIVIGWKCSTIVLNFVEVFKLNISYPLSMLKTKTFQRIMLNVSKASFQRKHNKKSPFLHSWLQITWCRRQPSAGLRTQTSSRYAWTCRRLATWISTSAICSEDASLWVSSCTQYLKQTSFFMAYEQVVGQNI